MVKRSRSAEWTIEQTPAGLWDLFRDRRIVSYDHTMEEAMAAIRRHRSFVKGDTIVAINQRGFREAVR